MNTALIIFGDKSTFLQIQVLHFNLFIDGEKVDSHINKMLFTRNWMYWIHLEFKLGSRTSHFQLLLVKPPEHLRQKTFASTWYNIN